jgi:myosin VI
MKYRQKCVLMMQKYVRGYLARKQHQPRYRGIVKINGISANVKKMEEIANELKHEKDPMLKQIREIEEQIRLAVMKIKVIRKEN